MQKLRSVRHFRSTKHCQVKHVAKVCESRNSETVRGFVRKVAAGASLDLASFPGRGGAEGGDPGGGVPFEGRARPRRAPGNKEVY